MNNFATRLAWTDFVYELQHLLSGKGSRAPAFVVGGAVRDAYLRRAIKDIDIAVDGDAVAMARYAADCLAGDIFVMDKERGVARMFAGGAVIDFARFRGAALEDDLRDRDFTMNAMAADLLGDVSALIDPLDGAGDLRRKVLRRCSEHAIQADPIRSLRAVRQSAQFRLKIHPDTLSDVRRYSSRLAQSSSERVRDEFFKLLGLSSAARGLRVLQHLGILKHIIPEIDSLVGMGQPWPQQFDVWRHTLLVVERMSQILTAISSQRTDHTAAAFDLGMLVIQFDRFRPQLQGHIAQVYGNGRAHQELLVLAALIHNLGKAQAGADYVSRSAQLAQTLARSLRLTAGEGKKLVTMISNYRRIIDQKGWSVLGRHRFWYRLGESGIDAILLAAADFLGIYGAELEQKAWLEWVEAAVTLLDAYFNHYETLVNPKLLLNGDDMMKLLDIETGPVIGRLLTALREAQGTGDVETVSQARDFVMGQFKALQ